MKRILIITATLVTLLFSAQAAHAAQVQGEIELKVYGKGKVTAPGFDCGSGATDCTETVSWDDGGPAPEIALTTISTATGWAATSWSGCTRFNAERNCVLTFVPGKKTALVYFNDVQAPTVFINAYTGRTGDKLNVQVQASDNDRITQIEYLLDDEVVLTRTSDWGMTNIDTTQVAEGIHTIQVRAKDGNHNTALSAVHQFTVDHTAPRVELIDPVAATNADQVSFLMAFPDDDVHNSYCTIRKQGDDTPFPDSYNDEQYCWDDAPYGKEGLDEGVWEFVVEANDIVDNKTRIVHEFVVDRTAPAIEFDSGPADGVTVEPGEIAYTWTVAEENPASQTCTWDGGDAESCDGSSARNLGAGDHSLTVTATDAAGNTTTATRSLTVKKAIEPDPDPDPDPDTTDRTAPAVKLVAPKQNLKSLRKALRLRVRCNEACAGRVVVTGKGGLKFAGRVYLTRAGVAKLKLRPTARVRKRLNLIAGRSLRARSLGRKVPARALKLSAAATLKDQAGNTGKATLKFKVTA